MEAASGAGKLGLTDGTVELAPPMTAAPDDSSVLEINAVQRAPHPQAAGLDEKGRHPGQIFDCHAEQDTVLIPATPEML
jgi:hypothetical protein